MPQPEPEVAVFARNGGRVLLEDAERGLHGICRLLSGTPEETAKAVAEDVLSAPGGYTLVRIGDPVGRDAAPVHPILLDVYSRELGIDAEGVEWRHATDLRGESAAPTAWDAYLAIAPTVEEVVTDWQRGSTAVSLEALQVLRDAAAEGSDWQELTRQANRIIGGRRDLTALVTRVDRTMSRAAERSSPAAWEGVAREEIDEAVRSDEAAAEQAAAYCEGKTVLTLSQSGTVQAALSMGNPAEVILLESRPECEAIPVAETLAAEGMDVSLYLDAAVGDVICRRDVDLVLVGADSIDPNGDVRNKVGTRTLAMAATQAGIPVIATTSSDKVAKGPAEDAWIDGHEIYDGPHDIDTKCRLFDRTPPELITELVTEVGPVTPNLTIWIAAERRKERAWRDRPERLQSA